MLNITLRQLQYLVAVADRGSVTGAAADLRLSQSTVSAAISEVERLLKVTVFVRHARGLAPTRDGEFVLAQARRLLRDASTLELNAAALGRELVGSLHIGCYSTIGPLVLPHVVSEFRTRHPRVQVSFSEGDQTALLADLAHGRSDVAVLYDYPFGTRLDELGFACVKLDSVTPYVLLPADHRLASDAAVELADLADDPFILFDLEPSGRYFRSVFAAEGVEPKVSFTSSNPHLVRSLVARGKGYTLLNQRLALAQSMEGRPYAARELAQPHPGLDVMAVTPAGQRPSERVAEFVRVAAAGLRERHGLLSSSPEAVASE